MSDIINQNTEPLFIFDMPDDETLSETISVKGEKGEKGDPTKLSQLDNDTGFITAGTDALTNYYDKTAADALLDTKLDKTTFNAYEIPSDFFTGDATVSGSGSSITLQNTARAKLKDIVIYGSPTTQTDTPTPTNPTAINATSGVQTIVIAGDSSQTYALDLGDIRLNTLGTYKDRIWKNSTDSQFYNANLPTDAWCLHKETADITLDGTENGNLASGYFQTQVQAKALFVSQPSVAYSTHFEKLINTTTTPNSFDIRASSTVCNIRTRFATMPVDYAEFRGWLAENKPSYCAPLQNFDDVEITDTNLVAQLNALANGYTYLGGTTISVTGSLPMLLDVEAYSSAWSGTLDGLNAGLDDRYTKEQVDNLIGDRVRFIFPKFWEGAGSGDCNLIKYGGKNILIDCYTPAVWSNVKAMLDDNDAKHIDYFILTHFHADHYGNMQNLIQNGYIDANTIILSAAETTTYGTNYNNRKTTVLGWLSSANLSYRVPQENEVLYINDLKLTFVNCDKDIIDAYPVKYENSNSTCILIEHGNTKAFYAADAGTAVYERLRGLGFPNSNVDLYKMGHHGIDLRTDAEFIRRLSPVYAVQPSGASEADYNQYGNCEDAAVLKALGTKIYPTHMQKEYIELESDGSSIQCINGTPYGTSSQNISMTYYVDKNASTNEIQDGTQEHPFSEIMQAVSSIPFESVTEVTINVADGYYGKAHPTTDTEKNRVTINAGKNVKITINGNSSDRSAVVVNGFWIQKSSVVLKDLTIDVDQHDGIFAYDSLVVVNGVTIKSNTDTASETKSGLLVREGSRMLVEGSGLRVEQVLSCIHVQRGSTFLAYATVEIGDYTTFAFNVDGSSKAITGNYLSFDNDADKLAFKGYDLPVKTPVQIMAAHDNYAQSVTLLQSVSNYAWIEIKYHTSDSFYGTTGKIYSPNNKKVGVMQPKLGGDGTLYNKQCAFSISGTGISITESKEVHITSGSSPTITNLAAGFNIDAVIAGFTDYIDLSV